MLYTFKRSVTEYEAASQRNETQLHDPNKPIGYQVFWEMQSRDPKKPIR
jgi:hypothetical protein